MKFRKKPVVIDAMEWTGSNHLDITDFCPTALWHDSGRTALIIPTLEGCHTATKGDFIIKGVKGEFYPCKPDIFAATYEAAEN